MQDFDLKQYLIENRLTKKYTLLKEENSSTNEEGSIKVLENFIKEVGNSKLIKSSFKEVDLSVEQAEYTGEVYIKTSYEGEDYTILVENIRVIVPVEDYYIPATREDPAEWGDILWDKAEITNDDYAVSVTKGVTKEMSSFENPVETNDKVLYKVAELALSMAMPVDSNYEERSDETVDKLRKVAKALKEYVKNKNKNE